MAASDESVHLLANPAAGRGTAMEIRNQAAQRVIDLGMRPVLLEASSAQEAGAVARAAVRNGASRFVVVGGDGLVHHVLPALVRTASALGIIPVGTGNDFARALGLPLDSVDAAIDAALGQTRRVDAMRIGRRWAATVAAVGFAVDVNRRAEHLRLPLGEQIYNVATLAELPALKTRTFRLVLDERPIEIEGVLLAIGNTAWFGRGMQICPDAATDDGQLHLTLIGSVGRLKLLRSLRSVFDGSHVERNEVTTFRARRVAIAGDVGEVWADGERIGPTPMTIEAVQRALLVAAPD